MAESPKDTIYVDVDDEITAIIDKLQASSGKVVALVLPKRAATLQSIVNMKLLKRAVDESKKNVVLITTESGILPLAGAVGLHVAATPTSRPEIPVAPTAPSNAEEQVDETAELLLDDELSPAAAATPVGVLAGETMPLPPSKDTSAIETVELDNAGDEPAAATATANKPKTPKPKKDKKLHIPDFDRFRLLAILGGALLLILIIGGYLALAVLPKATIAIQTDASNVNTSVDLTLSTSAKSFNEKSKTLPATMAQTQKTYTGTANASGQQNTGDKAHGQVTLSSACANGIQTVPQGTGVSSGGQTYITQRDVTLSSASGGRNNCTFSGTTEITAQNPGTKYNISGSNSFTVSSSSSGAYTASSITGNGSAAGGTDQIQTVVSQADIDSAKGKIATDNSGQQSALTSQLKGQGLYAVAASYSAGTPSVTSSANAGDAASNVTVTETITYTMLGTSEANLKTLVDNDIKSQIDTSQQGILTEGISSGTFKVNNTSANGASLTLQTTATVGPSIDTDTVAKAAVGRKSGDIKASLKSNPDVTNVDVHFSPFWVTKAPKNTSKITVTVAKPSKTAGAE